MYTHALLLMLLLFLVPWRVVAQTGEVPAPTPLAMQVPLLWDYPFATAPTAFLVRRSLDGGNTWTDVDRVPGRLGSDISWTDTTLSVSSVPLVMQYSVKALLNDQTSEPSNPVTVTLGGQSRLPTTAVRVVGADSAETGGESMPGRNVNDGNPRTIWHTQWTPTSLPLPHWIILDLGGVTTVDGLAYLPRLDGKWNGTIAQYEVAVSMDNVTWGTPPAASGTWMWDTPVEQIVRFTPVQGRYVRLRAIKEIRGQPWTSAAGIGVYAAPISPSPGDVACLTTQPTPKTIVITCTLP